ncbi:sensor histidine kinase [Rhodococcus sp. UNC363MFTsu5.1]|uniref:sensor histidine kinase n=1 Tax=Rhodococcus sp. UNC363MFTsu5.1 TaxID=1449069 RepID=UPI000AAEE275|nr:histidine kinase [Rhodococcus sp. UNC363MFTsu5.1]
MKVVTEYLHRRIAVLPYDYPPAIPIAADLCLIAAATAAVAQRGALVPPGWALVGGLIAMSACLWLMLGLPLPRPSLVPWTIIVTTFAGTALLLLDPVPNDIAPFILIVAVAQVAATTGPRVSVPVAVAAAATIVAAATLGDLEGVPPYLTGVVLAWMVGFVLQTQLRLVQREREAVARRAAQAASDERRRIAREVHDVIAHSLSITLLHLTGARRALQEDRDVDEAIDALTDAERLGRQAMADIRQTVGLLDGGPARVAPEPDITDIPELVADFVRAGVHVKYDLSGSPEAVSAATGLGLYRITQESLANVVKHAPGETAKVRLRVAEDAVVVSIVNGTHRVPRPEPGAGSGLRGMRQRAELLGGSLVAGPDAHGWSVRAEFPLGTAIRNCALSRRIPGLS